MNNKNDIPLQLEEAIRLSFLNGFKEGTMSTIVTLYRVFTEHLNYPDNNVIILILKDLAKTHYPEKTISEYIAEINSNIEKDFPQILN